MNRNRFDPILNKLELFHHGESKMLNSAVNEMVL